MKKFLLLATVATMAFATAAFAADPAPADPVKADRNGVYVGGNLGSSTDSNSRIGMGVVAGYQAVPYARVELDIDHAWRTTGTGDMVMANVIGQYRIPGSTVTPYVLAGAGYGFDKFGSVKNHGQVALYDVGAGVRIALSQNVELDARYRNVRPIEAHNASLKDQHLLSAGLNYRF
ncbi:Outer membrane protein beta-barrel [uncultured Caudovirales phage]|uniref:Outer membrane protein beta-barrel n=1 Tax=uncultured Caudovirales phage TaxID=2100421 RepID=A0A6J5KMW9_9CAUD|nr:Outer membrane protein beta-barrel [uncultured Caudovirales phage]